MGVKATLRDIQSGFLSASSHTANNTLVEEALNKALDRTSNVDNAMGVDLDLGSQRLINVADGLEENDGVNLRQLRDAVADSIAAGDVGVSINNAVQTAVALALQEAGTGFVVQKTESLTGFSNGQTSVNLGTISYVPGVNNITVIRNGLFQTTGVDFLENNSNSITMTLPLVSTDMLTVKVNESTTNTTSNSNAISHFVDGAFKPLKDHLDTVDAQIDQQGLATNVLYVPTVNPLGAVSVNAELDTLRTSVQTAAAGNANAWLDNTTGDGASDNSVYITGMIAPFASTTPKMGWLLCDGSDVSRTTYSRLFADIGTTYGSGDGVSTFGLPLLRGHFVRGLNDTSTGIDANRILGTTQSDQSNTLAFVEWLNTSTYDLLLAVPEAGWSNRVRTGEESGGGYDSTIRFQNKGVETRPDNVAFPYFIKT